MIDESNIIRSFENAAYNVDELDREILRTIREVMITHDLWESHHEGAFEEIVNPNGALYVPQFDNDDSWADREEINAFMRALLYITFAAISVSLYEDGEQGMTYLYAYVSDHDIECGCTDPYCGV